MKYFLSTNFIDTLSTIELISVGLVSEDSRKLYLINSEYNYKDASQWTIDNIIIPMYTNTLSNDVNNLTDTTDFHKQDGINLAEIKSRILSFIGNDRPEFWGYSSDHDWVAFCKIFGTLSDQPSNFPLYCNDLKQSLHISRKDSIAPIELEFHALEQAEWNMKLYYHLFEIDNNS